MPRRSLSPLSPLPFVALECEVQVPQAASGQRLIVHRFQPLREAQGYVGRKAESPATTPSCPKPPYRVSIHVSREGSSGMAGWRLFGSAGVFIAGAAPGAREGRRPGQAEELDVPEDSARRWVKPADPDAVRWTNGLHRPSARSGGAGPLGPAAEAGTGDAASSSGLSMRRLRRTERQRSGGSLPGLTAAGRPATVCSLKVGFAPLAPCGRLPPGFS